MAIAEESSGTQAATVGTEHTLGTDPTTSKTRVLVVDANAIVLGETVELRIKMKVASGGTVRLAYLGRFPGPLEEPIVHSIPVAMHRGGSFTLKQVGGTGRSFDWQVLTID